MVIRVYLCECVLIHCFRNNRVQCLAFCFSGLPLMILSQYCAHSCLLASVGVEGEFRRHMLRLQFFQGAVGDFSIYFSTDEVGSCFVILDGFIFYFY